MVLVGEIAEAQEHTALLVDDKGLPAWDEKEVLLHTHGRPQLASLIRQQWIWQLLFLHTISVYFEVQLINAISIAHGFLRPVWQIQTAKLQFKSCLARQIRGTLLLTYSEMQLRQHKPLDSFVWCHAKSDESMQIFQAGEQFRKTPL